MKSIIQLNHKKIKIIALPFAGGSRYSYRELQHLIPENFKWETPELPGRGERMHEKCLDSIDAMTDDLLEQMLPAIAGSEYILYGHSMGSLLVYELTRKIVAAGFNLPAILYLTGRSAPSAPDYKKISGIDRAAFWQEIRKLGGLPGQLLDNEELMYFFESQLRSDLKAVEEYKYKELKSPLPVPISVCTGMQEGISFQEVVKWQKETAHPLDIQTMPGHHFFVFQHPHALIKRILQAYFNCKAQYRSMAFIPGKDKIFIEKSGM